MREWGRLRTNQLHYNQIQMQVLLSQHTCRSLGKAPGPDGIPIEIYKHWGAQLVNQFMTIFRSIWDQEKVPQYFKDANIAHIYKMKGDGACCDNHRVISLLATAGKVLSKIITNRLVSSVTEKFLPETQCGFRSGRSTVDMLFTARQIQEKCRKQQRDLYLVFIDLTKAFDTVNRECLWALLRKIGCPEKLVNVIRSFHDGMTARVIDAGELSSSFSVKNGTKQNKDAFLHQCCSICSMLPCS